MNNLQLDNSTLNLRSSTDASFMQMDNFVWKYEQITSFFIVELTNQMFKSNNNYTFSVSFQGSIKDNLVGFYRSSYLDSDNNRRFEKLKTIFEITKSKNINKKIIFFRWVMVSMTCFVEARNAFLCFDEPAFKAVFKIKIIHDESMSAMANMPVKQTKYLYVYYNFILNYVNI